MHRHNPYSKRTVAEESTIQEKLMEISVDASPVEEPDFNQSGALPMEEALT